jgi:hypothetical protein
MDLSFLAPLAKLSPRQLLIQLLQVSMVVASALVQSSNAGNVERRIYSLQLRITNRRRFI